MKSRHAAQLALLALTALVAWIIWSLKPSGWTP